MSVVVPGRRLLRILLRPLAFLETVGALAAALVLFVLFSGTSLDSCFFTSSRILS